ncbi:FprA family A-type flavoprotein [Methanosarcinales archaeon]|nr:MAG: FprA family A-type flavoprotein [Methanosarcinales archaeon]
MAKAVIVYATVHGYTKKMAEAIGEGLMSVGVEVKLINASKAKADDLNDADAVALGCPTYARDLIYGMKRFLSEMEKADVKGKIGAAFGSYDWSGESVSKMDDKMRYNFNMDMIEPLRVIGAHPSGLKDSNEFGRKIADKIKIGDCFI